MDTIRTLTVLFVFVALIGGIVTLFTTPLTFSYFVLPLIVIYLLIVINRPEPTE